jgi:hypothetical protein
VSADYTPKPGDTVRITIEGVFDLSCRSDGTNGVLSLPNLDDIWIRTPKVTHERLSTPEQWQPGDVARNADDSNDVRSFVYAGPPSDPRPWRWAELVAYEPGVDPEQWVFFVGQRGDLPANLRLLVRDGQPVEQPNAKSWDRVQTIRTLRLAVGGSGRPQPTLPDARDAVDDGCRTIADYLAWDAARTAHPQPGDVVTEEPPVGSVVRDRSGSTWTQFKLGEWWCGSVPADLQSGNEFAWAQRFAPLTLVRWGADS